jgi:regulator of protease activity HflC (stomatin/prohibitin superfamily)
MPTNIIEMNSGSPKKELLATWGLGAVALVLFLAFQTFHIVPPGHRGISVLLGRVDLVQRPEGLTFQWPFVQTIKNFPIMQLKMDGQAESFSSDLQNMTIFYTVMYRVPESQVVRLFREYRGDPYTTLIEPRLQEVVKQVAALSRAEDLVKNREKMKVDILERARPEVGDLLEIVDVSLTNIDLSDQLEQAIEQKVVREQEALAKTFELDKEKKQAEITIVRAEAEAKSVSIKGEAIKASPEVIQLEIAQRWDGKAPLSVSVGQNGAGANVLLPLGK